MAEINLYSTIELLVTGTNIRLEKQEVQTNGSERYSAVSMFRNDKLIIRLRSDGTSSFQELTDKCIRGILLCCLYNMQNDLLKPLGKPIDVNFMSELFPYK